MNELSALINRFANEKIVIVGDVMLDKYTYGDFNRISPEAPVPIIDFIREEYKVGGAGNVALNVKSLSPSSNIYLFGFAGEDTNGKILRKLLKEKKINYFFETSNSITTTKERIISSKGGATQQMLRVDREDRSKKEFSKNCLINLSNLAREADIIVVSDYAKGAITSELMKALSSYREKIIIDPKPKNPESPKIYNEVFLIKPNNLEAGELIQDYGGIESLRRYFNSNIFVTRGGEGGLISHMDEVGTTIKLDTKNVELAEPTGAGDTVMAILALGLARDKSLDSLVQTAILGNIAAGITVRNQGAYTPSLNELKMAVTQYENNQSKRS